MRIVDVIGHDGNRPRWIDNAILSLSYALSFGIVIIVRNAPSVSDFSNDLLWLVGFIPLLTVIVFTLRYRELLATTWSYPSLARRTAPIAILFLVFYGLIFVGTNICPSIVGSAFEAIGIKVVLCLGAVLLGYGLAALSSLLLIYRIIFDRAETLTMPRLFAWWAFWLPILTILVLRVCGVL